MLDNTLVDWPLHSKKDKLAKRGWCIQWGCPERLFPLGLKGESPFSLNGESLTLVGDIPYPLVLNAFDRPTETLKSDSHHSYFDKHSLLYLHNTG